jgi:hypothetical protein
MSEPTGIDLARQMLNAARAEARKHGTQPARKRPTARARRNRGDGREPVKLGTAIDQLAEQFGWQKPSAGARVVISWPEIAPDLAHLAAPERYDAATRTLHLRPASPAAATHLRLQAPGLPDRINAHTGAATVQAVRVLPPGPLPARPAQVPQQAPAAELAPPRTRQDASAGYHRALTAHQDARTTTIDPMPPAVRDAIEEQDQALRAKREPENAFADTRELLDTLQQRAEAAADPRTRALARARAEKAGHPTPAPPAAARTA